LTQSKHGVKLQSTRIDVSRFDKPSAMKLSIGPGGHQIDEHYLNSKIAFLNEERLRIHALAEKYGLKNNVKIN
jgi:hypothetical protein